MGVTATIQAPDLSVEPGGVAESDITVRNTGTIVDQLSFELVGAPATWASVEPPAVSLFPDGEEVVRLRFAPPRDAAIQPGSFGYALKVASAQQDGARAVEEGTLHVGAYRETSAELLPQSSRARRVARHQVALDNRGNQAVRAVLAATDPEEALVYTFEPAELVANPGTAAFSMVRVTPKNRFWRGPSRSHSFTAMVQPDGEAPIPLQGTMLQEAMLPRWLPRAAMAALAGLIALAALWFGLLRPRIDSALENAADDAAEQAAEKATDGVPGGGDGPLGTPQNPVSMQVVEGPAPTPGEPFDRRLSPGVFEVPAGKRLDLSDIVFQNADGAIGYATLSRNDATQTLLRLNLANFRDYDFHFVSPVVFGPGDKLMFDISCPLPDGTAGTCNGPPALFVVGTLSDAT